MPELAPLVVTADEPPDFGQAALDITFESTLLAGRGAVEAALALLHEDGRVSEGRREYHAWLCLEEFVTNAIRHGNKFDETKTGRLQIFLHDHHSWTARVQDSGVGFDPRDVPDPLNNLHDDHGRGIFLVRSLVKEVCYYDKGRCSQFTYEPADE